MSAPSSISPSRVGFIEPSTIWIFAGCLSTHAVAMALALTPYLAPFSSSALFSSGKCSLPTNGPYSVPDWNGLHAWMVMWRSRE